tara:strand:- start:123 stop:371 length:249 start_codon:yes stop_codon:yes gene_type:complete
MGYPEDELTYKSVKEIEDMLKALDEERKKAIETIPNTRNKSTKPLGTRYVEDALYMIKGDKKAIDVKSRWTGIKGLDGSVDK